jgi:hypothetical protein
VTKRAEGAVGVDVSVETVIARPRGEVFAYTTRLEHDPVWTSGLVEARRLDGDAPFGRGTKIERISRFLGRKMVYTLDVVAFEPGALVEMVTTAAPFPMNVRYEYEDHPDGCRFRIRTTGDPGGFFGLAIPIVAPAVRRSIAHDLATLKDVLERAGSPPPPSDM